MVRILPNRSTTDFRVILEQALQSGQLRRQDHLLLASTLLVGYKITEDDRRQINRVFDAVHLGRIKLID